MQTKSNVETNKFIIMTKKIFLLLFSILSVSCEKESEDSLLTSGKWILEDMTARKKTVQFNNDHTYVIESEVLIPTPYGYSCFWGIISGSWIQQNDRILFLSAKIEILDDKSFSNITANPLGFYYGFDWKWKRDESDTREDNLPKPDIVITDTIIWTIMQLTKQELVVECNGEIRNYHQ